MTTVRKPHVLCIGECMAELAPLEVTGDFRLGFAGDTFNTAWYLRQLRPDIGISYLSAVGTDDISTRMLRFMDEAGIGTGPVARLGGHSVGMYMISLSEGERSFSYWRDTSAARRLADDDAALGRAIGSASVIYFSGITLAILDDDARGRLLRHLERARAGGKTVAFDPNLRPLLWADETRMTSAIIQGACVSDILLPSFEDEAMQFGDATPSATAKRYQAAGASVVVVKNGPEPVLVLNADGQIEIAVDPVERVVDTTSAGDSFNAGFLAGLGRDASMPERIRLASAVAGQVVGGKGALVPLRSATSPMELTTVGGD